MAKCLREASRIRTDSRDRALSGGEDAVTWLGWGLLFGRPCRELMVRAFELYPWRFRRNPRSK